MKKLLWIPTFRIIPAIIIAVCLIGCIQDHVVINLNPDGSGTIEETITSNMFLDKIKKECEKDGDCPTEDQVAAQLAEDTSQYARHNAELFGEGVTFVAVEPIRIDKRAGSKAIYRFDDINKIKINKDPMSRTGGPIFRGRSGSDDEKILFSFKKGSPAELKIAMFPPEWMEAQLDREPEPQDDEDFKNSEMNELMRSGKMYIGLCINGDIVKSNATYQTGRDIALIDILFQDLLDKNSMMNSLRTNPPKSVQEYKERIKGSKNFKLELTTPVIINFK